MVWCSSGTKEGAGNHLVSVLEFNDGKLLTRAPKRAPAIISYQCSSFMMVWCSQGTTKGSGNHPVSVLKFHDGLVLREHHRGRPQSSVISARIS